MEGDSDYEGMSDPSEEEDMELGSSSDDLGYDPGAEVIVSSKKAHYKVISKQDLIKRQSEALSEVTSVLGVTDEDATRVLRKYKW